MGTRLFLLVIAAACVGVKAGLRGESLFAESEARRLREQLHLSKEHLSTFDRAQEARIEYIEAKVKTEDLQHRLKLLYYVKLGVMTKDEYERLSRLQAEMEEITARHHHTTKKNEIHELKVQANELEQKFTTEFEQIKSKAHKIENAGEDEYIERVRGLRKRIAETDDREEVALLRLELEGVYSSRPQPTAKGRKAAGRRAAREKEIRRRAAEKKNPRRGVNRGRVPQLTDDEKTKVEKIRAQLSTATEREDVTVLRDQLETLHDKARRRERENHAKMVERNQKASGSARFDPL